MVNNFEQQFDTIDRMLTGWMARVGLPLLRISIGLVYFWFGVLKLMPGLSPAEGLIRESLPFLPMDFFIPFLGVWEMVIGIGFISGKFMRAIILLMLLQMVGAAAPIVLNPDAVFVTFPFVLTLEGQYIIKNTILISAALVIGASLRADVDARTTDRA